jgi:hypothetical protein
MCGYILLWAGYMFRYCNIIFKPSLLSLVTIRHFSSYFSSKWVRFYVMNSFLKTQLFQCKYSTIKTLL